MDSFHVNKLKSTSNNYSACFPKLTKHVGSIQQCSLTSPLIACLLTSSPQYDEYPVIIESGAIHHIYVDRF